MRAWRFNEFGDIANFKLGEYPAAEPGEGEVLIELRYAALNPADRLLIEGRYPGAGDLPLTVGRDGSGTVVKALDGSAFSKGDSVVVLRSEVGITRQGTLAESATVPERSVALLPGGWSFEEGAAAPLVYLTAWKALMFQGKLETGQNLLVNGASGGVGVAAVQLGKALGAKVVALSRSAEHRAKLCELGASSAIDSDASDMEEQVKAAFGGGADVVVENLGGKFLQSSVNLANLNGRIMVIGLLTGPKVELTMGQVLFKQVRIEGVHVGKFAPPEARDAWDAVVDTLKAAGARPLIDEIFPMDKVQEAFARLAGGHMGKVLVDVAAS